MTCDNYVHLLFQSHRKTESPSNIQKLKSDKNLVNGIIKNLPENSADQVTEAILKIQFNAKRPGKFFCAVLFYRVGDSFFFYQAIQCRWP